MNTLKAIAAIVCVAIVPATLVGQASSATSTGSTGYPAIDEANLIAKAHDTETACDTATTDTLIASPSLLPDWPAPSVTLARRAVSVATWLQGDNNYQQAELLGQRVEKTLAALTETNTRDQEERLYWEAVLEGRILDQKVVAISLLEQARALSSTDQRVLQLETDFANAVATFGH